MRDRDDSSIKKIIIHTMATPPSVSVGLKEVGELHMASDDEVINFGGRLLTGKGFRSAGYHLCIRRSGQVEYGRKDEEQGAHARGHNHDSLAVVLEGGVDEKFKPECNYTAEQWAMLENTVELWQHQYGPLHVYGHNEFANKACPCFNVEAWWYGYRRL